MRGEGAGVPLPEVPLGSLGSFSRGRGGTKADARPSGVPCIRYGDLYTHHDSVVRGFASFIDPASVSKYTLLVNGDVVFAASGETHAEIGKAAVYVGHGVAYAGADTIIFRPRSAVDPTFIGYAVNTETAARHKARFGQGSSVIHISAAHLGSLRLPATPLPEQRRIAEILDTLDEAIRKTEQVVAKLQQMKQGLLHDLLTRGIDEHGELRDPERCPEQFKDSLLGQIPRRWQIRCGDEVCRRIEVGIVIRPTQYYASGGVPVLRSANVRESGIELSDLKFMSERDHGLLSKSAVQPGELVTVRTGYPGTTAVIPDSLQTANCVDIIISRPGSSIRPAFLARWVNSDEGKGQVLRVQGGLAQQHFNVGEMKKLLVALPTLDEQDRIVAANGDAEDRLSQEREEANKLRTLKHGLMDDLLTGRVRVAVHDEATP